MRRHEEIELRMVFVSYLSAMRVAYEALNSFAKKEKIEKKDFPLWFSDNLVSIHTKLSALFEAFPARLMPADVYLAFHLSSFRHIYSRAENEVNH
jgi:hypothetical protein